MLLQGYFKGGFQECFKGSGKEVSKLIQETCKAVSGKLQGCVKKVLRVFQGNSKASWAFLKCLNEVLRVFQSLPKMVCFVAVIWHSAQPPEQKEGVFFFGRVPKHDMLNPSNW